MKASQPIDITTGTAAVFAIVVVTAGHAQMQRYIQLDRCIFYVYAAQKKKNRVKLH